MDEHRPLDSLIPDLARSQPIEGMSQGPEVHAQVFEVQLEDGHEWLYSIWREPNELTELERQLRRLLEVTQLMYLSGASKAETPNDFRSIRILVFDQLSEGAVRTLEAFGFERTIFEPDQYRNRMLSLENQAMQAGWSIPARPKSVWHAPIVRPDPALLTPLLSIERRLRQQFETSQWGEVPGESSKLLADQIKKHFGVDITPDAKGLDQLDVLLLDHTEGKFRWMMPGIFRALCDFVGVYIQANHPLRVGWAVAKKDADFPAPPIFRVNQKNRAIMYPVGQYIIRWAVMPDRTEQGPRILSQRIEASLNEL